ncbi:helix-turn-helix domain-containing protein [Serratia marcescens]|nr:helix-turn-helix domain-containing protein [Serratia marcescens]ELQ9442103.1 helix-turn-helix domain-containing protein [Serratia marcescens]ELT5562893.1 helix-turn-helix domain-containing protein [Serratia marcescens]
MGLVTVMSNCQFTGLALKVILNSIGIQAKLTPINLHYFYGDENKREQLFIHVRSFEYTTIASLLSIKNSTLFKEAIFIAEKELVLFLSLISHRKLAFINERASAKELRMHIANSNPYNIKIDNMEALSIRECLVLRMLISGLSLTKIACKTKRSIKTVSAQKISALNKLNLKNSPHSLAKLNNYFRSYLSFSELHL